MDPAHPKYRELVADSESIWKITDQNLYALCRKYPRHNDPSAVCAKLWIIGRTFATGIERKIATKHTQGSSMSQVADHFTKHGARIDSWFDELRVVSAPLDDEKCGLIVSIHGRMVRLLRPITRKKQSTPSFVSKYMHFHNSVVPIYDGLALASLRGLMRWSDSMAVFKMPSDADKEYGWYVMRFLALHRQLAESGLRPTTRNVDYYLLSLAGGR